MSHYDIISLAMLSIFAPAYLAIVVTMAELKAPGLRMAAVFKVWGIVLIFWAIFAAAVELID